MTEQFEIAELLPEHACEVAELHISGIRTGFISSLGSDFVEALYKAIAESKSSFGFVAEKNSKIVGFAAFTSSLGKLYISVVLKKGVRFALLLAGELLSVGRIKKIMETLFYPQRTKKMKLPAAELLSVVVAEAERGRGLAARLVREGLTECTKKGIDKVKVLVGSDNQAANRLYTNCGFRLIGQIDNHGVLSNVYVAQTSGVSS